MTIVFSPDGSLDVAKDPSDLPESANNGTIVSGAMVRCKNLRLDQKGIAKTRDGSAKLNESAIESISWLEVMAGTRYAFGTGNIYSNESSIASGLTDAQWSAIQYNAFNDTTQNIFALNGTDRKRIQSGAVYEWGIAAPTTAPTLDVGQGSGLTGTYNAKYTYVRKVNGVIVAESDPSPAASPALVLSSQSLSVDVTQPSDSQVTHIRLYRTQANGGTYFYDQEIAVSTSYAYGYTHDWEEDEGYIAGTGYKFTTADSARGTDNVFSWEAIFETTDTSTISFDPTLLASINPYLIGNDIWYAQSVADGETDDEATSLFNPVYTQPFDEFDSIQADAGLGDILETDHDRPPLGSFVFGPAYDGTCFVLKDNRLYYCKPKQPEYWPELYYIEVGAPQFPLKTGVFHNGQVYVFSETEMYYIQGTGHGSFLPLPMKAKAGAQSIRGAVAVTGKGIFHTGPDGVYQWSSGTDTKITEDALEPLFRGETVQGIPGVADMSSSWLFVYRNNLYFGYRSTGFTHPTNVLVVNLDTGRIAYYTYDDGSEVEIRSVAVDTTNKRLLIGDHDGYVRVIESPSYTDDSGTAIEYELQSKDFILSTRLHFPRWNKYDVDASSATSCTGALILGGAVHHSHTITGSRSTRRRLVDTGNGNRCALRISGSGPVTIYAAESE